MNECKGWAGMHACIYHDLVGGGGGGGCGGTDITSKQPQPRTHFSAIVAVLHEQTTGPLFLAMW